MSSRVIACPRFALACLACALFLTPVAAQQSRPQKSGRAQTKEDLANARAGRDPNQPLDEEYTKKIKEYTTETFFLSPLVDETDDTRIGMGLQGLIHLREFIDAGGVFVGSNSSAEFAIANFTYGVTLNRPGTGSRVVGSLLRTRLVDQASPIVYGVPDNLAMYSDRGESFSVSANVGGAGRGAGGGGGVGGAGGGRGGGPGGRPTGRGTPDDPDVVQGRPAVEGTNLSTLPTPQTVQPWQYALPTEEALRRNPATLIPPQFRPRVAVRFDAQNTLLVSGLLDGGADIAQQAVVVDVPIGKSHLVLFANNPIWRGETIGSYFLVFNTILNFDSLDAGRTLDPR